MTPLEAQLQQVSKDTIRHVLFDEFQKVSFMVQMLNAVVQNDVTIPAAQVQQWLAEAERVRVAFDDVMKLTTKFLTEGQHA